MDTMPSWLFCCVEQYVSQAGQLSIVHICQAFNGTAGEIQRVADH